MPPTSTTAAACPTLLARALGVLRSPRLGFERVVRCGRWVDMLLVTVVSTVGASALFLATDIGRQALVDQRVDLIEGFGGVVDDGRYAAIRQSVGTLRGQQLGVLAAGIPMLTVAIGLGARACFGGTAPEATLTQSLAVAAHAGVTLVARFLLLLPWNYVRESLGSPLSLSVLAPGLAEGSFAASFLGSIDLFMVWWATALAIGFAVLYHRKVRAVALPMFATYGVIALAIAGAKSALGGQ